MCIRDSLLREVQQLVADIAGGTPWCVFPRLPLANAAMGEKWVLALMEAFEAIGASERLPLARDGVVAEALRAAELTPHATLTRALLLVALGRNAAVSRGVRCLARGVLRGLALPARAPRGGGGSRALDGAELDTRAWELEVCLGLHGTGGLALERAAQAEAAAAVRVALLRAACLLYTSPSPRD